MPDHNFNQQFRYGSADFASTVDLSKGGYYRTGGIPIGYDDQGRVLHVHGDQPLCMIGGAGSGKLTGVLGRIVCTYPERIFCMDLKGELSSVSIDNQWRYKKHHYCINPFHLHGLPSHRVNPLAFLQDDSPTLTADCKLIAGFLIADQGGEDGGFFILRARSWLAALLEYQVLKQGKTDLIRFTSLINAIDGDINTWAHILAEAETHPREDIKRTFAEMKFKQVNAPKEFGGVMGVIYNALDWMSDQNIASTVAGGDFTLDVLCDEQQKANISLIIPAENIGALSGFMRLVIGVTALHKSRKPSSPKVLFVLDEAAQLGNFPMLRQMMSYGRGAGIQTMPVFQDTGQIVAHHGKTALQTFIGSAKTRIFLGVRDHITARMVSEMLGTQTLEYNPEIKQQDARRQKLHALRHIMEGDDPLAPFFDVQYQAQAQSHQSKQQRDLMTPAEVLNMPANEMLIFTADTPPIRAQRFNYFDRRDMAGLYFPNPYHPPLDKVQLRKWYGKAWREVVECDVPPAFRAYPQYQDGRPFRFIQGYR